MLHFSFPSTFCCLHFSRDLFFKICSARFILAALSARRPAAHLRKKQTKKPPPKSQPSKISCCLTSGAPRVKTPVINAAKSLKVVGAGDPVRCVWRDRSLRFLAEVPAGRFRMLCCTFARDRGQGHLGFLKKKPQPFIFRSQIPVKSLRFLSHSSVLRAS